MEDIVYRKRLQGGEKDRDRFSSARLMH